VHRSDERADTPAIVGDEGAISRLNDLVGSGKVARTMVIKCKA
jgi:hypothetical protein